MTTIQDLSNEIILSILENETISLSDVENFSFTCKGFEWISHYETLWKKKYAQKWPTAKQFCKDTMGIEFNDLNIEDFREGMKCAENLWLYVPRMSQMYYYCNKTFYYNLIHKDDLHTEKHPLNLLILRDELIKNIYHQDPRQCNLTERYYSKMIFHSLYQNIFNPLLMKRIIERPNRMQRLENLIVVSLQYCHPNKGITLLYIDKFIDNIMQDVLNLLKDKYLRHPILSISSEQLSIWRTNRINKNFWCVEDATSIKDVLDIIIISFDSYKSWMKPNQINKEDTLHYRQALWCAIYICVANRLGLHVLTTKHGIENNYALHSNTHLVWQSGKYIENRECFTFEWTDNTDNAKISHIKKCQVPPRFISLFSDRNLHLLGLPRSVEDSIIRDINVLWERACFPFDDFCHTTASINYYDEKICTPDKTFRKKRSPNLKYPIGLIVTHKHKMEDNTQKDVAGVIIGWHNECHIERFKYISTYCSSSYDVTEKCIQKNNIDNWKSQPHYVLLIEKDLCYVPQYAITSICKKWINNPEVGKYFCKFEDTHYVPNNMLGQHYPDDAAVVRDILLNNLKL
ncbi:F-box only protein 21-like isoform X2 [Nylanderia fulva]|uniref:F-box only protein 21-like isoform X2 n=1 Tax=Nylanderia fulva TaxID=613905 RepID=UPI0010FB5C4E|nr:F-box only protein 21-like isoform X2 [Nylanderia fulva]